jgi:hypothetical protein
MRPTVVDVRRLTVAEWVAWLAQHGTDVDGGSADPSTSIWELEFTDAALYQPCSLVDKAACVHSHLFLSLDASSGKNLGFLFPKGGTPANYTP